MSMMMPALIVHVPAISVDYAPNSIALICEVLRMRAALSSAKIIE